MFIISLSVFISNDFPDKAKLIKKNKIGCMINKLKIVPTSTFVGLYRSSNS